MLAAATSNESITPYAFLVALFTGAPDDAFLERRAIYPGGKVEQAFHPLRALRADGLAKIMPASLDGAANVYFGVCPRSRPEGKAEAVQCATTLWADMDSGLPEPWPEAIPKPSALIGSSPGKFQAFWFLDTPTEDLDRVVRLNRRLAVALHADTNACDIARVLRVPGFANIKYEAKPRAYVVVLR